MVKNLTFIITLCCFLGLACCGGGSSGSSFTDSVSLVNGPLAGTWIGSANDVTHTISISGRGNTYYAAWDTSDNCFTSDSGTTVHINKYVEILCSGYDDNQQIYIFLSIYGEYDGKDIINGEISAEECGADDIPFVLTRSK